MTAVQQQGRSKGNYFGIIILAVITVLTGIMVLAGWYTHAALLCTILLALLVFFVMRRERLILSAERRLSAILDNTVDGLITIDAKGTVQNYNKACEKMFGYSLAEIIGQNVKMLMPEPYRGEHNVYLANYEITGHRNVIGINREVEGQRKDGSVFPIDLSVSEVLVDGQRLYSGIMRDISERKKMEEDILRSNDALERFAYIASHDLKAPLRAITQLSQWIEKDIGPSLSDENRHNMELLRQRATRMDRLLNSLLEYSRVGRKRDPAENIIMDAETLVQEIVRLLDPPEGFEIVTSPSLKAVQVRQMPLQQVLLNLISNAIKHHGKKQGKVEITVRDMNSHYRFSVVDDGPGIPAKYHEKVFEMFQTLRPRDETEGSGIGLALVKKIVMQAGGRVTLESEEGKGTKFIFTWPKNLSLTEENDNANANENIANDQLQRTQKNHSYSTG